MIKRKLRRKYANFGISRGIAVGLFLSMLLMVLMLWEGFGYIVLIFTIPVAILLVVCGFVGFLIYNLKYNRINKRINSLEEISGNIDNDKFEHIAMEMSIGKRWLVYHKGLDYRFWTKETLGDVKKVGDNQLEIWDYHSSQKTILKVSTNLDLQDVLMQWKQAEQVN